MPHAISHDPIMVLLSFAVAYFASLTALDMGSRLRRAEGKARRLWLTGSAVVLGGGIWSMHFVAMLAMNANVPVAYAPGLTLFSLVIAIAIVAFGFGVVTQHDKPSIARQLAAGVIVGAGVSVMHYSGMAAMVLPGWLQYDPKLVAASVAIAVVAATAALWLTLNLRRWWQRAVAAGVMAAAVCGMHYTAMAATAICTDPGVQGTVDLASELLLVVGVSAGVFLILCLAMVCVFIDRRFEFLAAREAQALRAANDALRSSQEAVRNLLDNADQGFLTVGPDLTVDEGASAACTAVLGRPPAGEPIVDLLCESLPPDAAANMRETLASLFRDTDDYMRELKIELLPTEFQLDWTTLKVGYKFLAARDRLMLVLTDITETARLAEAVNEERRRLEMTVLSLRDADNFWSLVSDYRAFFDGELQDLARAADTAAGAEALYRRLHTFKGLLAQFGFRWSPLAVHDAETALAMRADAVALAATAEPLAEALARDLAVIGAGPAEAPESAPARLQAFAHEARQLLDAGDPSPARVRGFLASVAETGMIELKSTLELYSRSASRLADRLGKRLAPVEVSGDAVRLAPERHRAFLRSLVHVFRNAVDHGLEPPEDRIELDKPEAGQIRCAVRKRREDMEIVISDDGGGIDRETLAAKLAMAGASPERVRRMSLADLVFHQGLSARAEADMTSGRGVGLAAVKHELDRLGGSVAVKSAAGEGAQFVFRIPLEPAEAGEPEYPQLRKAAS